jgi:acyl dehydratase
MKETNLTGLTWQKTPAGFKYETGRRTIREDLVSSFVGLAGFFEPLFMDDEHTAEAGYSGRLVPAMLTLSIAEGLVILSGLINGTGMGLLDCDMKVAGPVYAGDTLHVEGEVTESRATSKGPARGIVTARNHVVNQSGKVVMEYDVVRLIRGDIPGGEDK